LYGRRGGIAITQPDPNGTFAIQYNGEVDASITGLGAGTKSVVRSNASTGFLERIANPNPNNDEIWGKCGADGGLTIDLAAAFTSGANQKWRKAFGGSTAYSPGDTSFYSGTGYVALTSSTGVTPGSDPTQWQQITATGSLAFNVKDYGAAGDCTVSSGGTDDSAAIQAAINAAQAYLTAGGASTAGAIVVFPPGGYRCASAISVSGSIILRGTGGAGLNGSTVLWFDNGIGIQDGSPGGCLALVGSARNARVENLLLIQHATNGGRDLTKVSQGLLVAVSEATLHNVTVSQFTGDGLEIHGDHTIGTNANGFNISGHCRFEQNGRYGAHVHGLDASGGAACGLVDLTNNGSSGLNEASFLGNGWVCGFLTEGNGIVNSSGWVSQLGYLTVITYSGSAGQSVSKGQRLMPPVANDTGYQYVVMSSSGTLGTINPGDWPTTIGNTFASNGVSILCWAERGRPINDAGNGENTFGNIYMEQNQDPCFIQANSTVLGGNAYIDLTSDPMLAASSGLQMPLAIWTQRKQSWESGVTRPVGAALGGPHATPHVAIIYRADRVADSTGNGWYSDALAVPGLGTSYMDIEWDPSIQRWANRWTNVTNWTGWTQAGARSGPMPSAVSFPSLYVSSQLGKELRITSIQANTPFYPYVSAANGTYQTTGQLSFKDGDLLLNNCANGGGSNRWPWGWRKVGKQAFVDANSLLAWGVNKAFSPGQVISQNGSYWRAREPGGITSGSLPSFVSDPTTDGSVTWDKYGSTSPSDSTFGTEPLIIEAPTMLSKDVSAGGTINLTEDESAHERIKFTGAPGAGVNVVVTAGAGAGWCRVFWNTCGQNVTVKAAGGDAGIAVPTATAYQLLSDGANATRVQ
jgi:hypothetical protein